MSLQVWLPLNGDLRNQGAATTTITNVGATVFTEGKIGSCYSFNGSNQRIDTGWGNGKPANNLTVCCWIKPLSGLNGKIVFGVLNGSNQRCYVGGANGTYNLAYKNQSWGRTTTAPITANVWSHLAVVIKNNVCSLYQNGVFIESLTGSGDFNLADGFRIGGRTDGYYSNMLANDFRIYDHALTVGEIKDIANGLILHYPMNRADGRIGGRNLSTSAQIIASGTLSFDKSNFDINGSFSFSKNGSATGVKVFRGSEYSVSTQYSISFYITKTSGTMSTFGGHNGAGTWNSLTIDNGAYVSATLSSGGTSDSGAGVYLNDGKRHYVHMTLTTKSTASTDYAYIQPNRGNATEVGVLIENFKVEEGSAATIWTPAAWASTDVIDCSGYGRNGTSTDIKWDIEKRLGDGSYYFDGVTSYVDVGSGINYIVNGNPFTLAFWINPSETGRAVLFGDHQLTGGVSLSIEMNYSGVSDNRLRFYWNSNPDIKTWSSTTMPKGQWTHIAITYNGSRVAAYKNGAQTNYNDVTLTSLNKTSGNFRIGRDARTGETLFNGLLQDFRIYATALSETEINKLYKSQIRIYKNNTISGITYNEASTIPQFKKSGAINAAEIVENTTTARIYKNANIGANELREA